ncbi:hypothetical protein [Coleofasciculus sp.]|uniref:hypothetical protein n=1 Tax=Coleofasciculus sp. TaxID=3100458 RepID=UPI003A47C0A0
MVRYLTQDDEQQWQQCDRVYVLRIENYSQFIRLSTYCFHSSEIRLSNSLPIKFLR